MPDSGADEFTLGRKPSSPRELRFPNSPRTFGLRPMIGSSSTSPHIGVPPLDDFNLRKTLSTTSMYFNENVPESRKSSSSSPRSSEVRYSDVIPGMDSDAVFLKAPRRK